jgi:hypothetical protein
VAVLYSRSFHLKRFAIICHSDNFVFRVHAYREKTFKLVNHSLRSLRACVSLVTSTVSTSSWRPATRRAESSGFQRSRPS